MSDGETGTERGFEPQEADKGFEWLESIDHTGDAGFVVYGDDLGALFSRAAWAMFSIIGDVDAVHSTETIGVVFNADDRHELLVTWLSELNYLHVTQHRLYCCFDVHEISETGLRAEVGGEPIDRNRHTVFTEVKAITYHQLRIEEVDGGWKARVIVDL